MSFALGPLAFTAPLALLALIGLPLLWFVLRATPPQPKTQVLPSLALFEDLAPKEETPDQTPWWIILLRMMMITLAIIGLSAPVWSPSSSGTGEDTAPENMLLMVVTLLVSNARGWLNELAPLNMPIMVVTWLVFHPRMSVSKFWNATLHSLHQP